MAEKIVYACVANSEGIQIYQGDSLEMNPIIQLLVENIDFSVDDKRIFGAHERTKGMVVQYMVKNNRAYVCSTTSLFPHRMSSKFLEFLATEFEGSDFSSPKAITEFESY